MHHGGKQFEDGHRPIEHKCRSENKKVECDLGWNNNGMGFLIHRGRRQHISKCRELPKKKDFTRN